MSTVFSGQGIAILGPFPPRPGGVSVQCATLAHELERSGARVTRINTDLPSLRRRGRLGRLLMPGAQVFSLIRQLRQTRGRWQILHVHAASWWGFMPAVVGLVARWWRKRLVLTYHGGEAAQFMARRARLATWTLKHYDRLVTLTPTQARIFAAYGLDAVVVPNIVPVDDFHFRERAELTPHMLWLRQLEPRYRPADALAVLLQVQARYADATLTLAGGGSVMAGLRAQVENRQIGGVRFSGQLAMGEISAAYDDADIFLNTSAIDNLPITLIEASASGLPIVSSTAGAIPDLIQDGENGLLAAVGDVEALAECVIKLLDDPTLARRLSRSARLNAERFAWERIAPELASVYGLTD